MKSMSKFGSLDLHLFNLYLRFQLILHTLYNIAIAVAQNDFLVGHYIGPSLADHIDPTPCFSSGQRLAQQLAQRCPSFIGPTRYTKCQHVINHLT
jgi:hypothetical protein